MSSFGGEQMVVGLLRLRFAAGVCVLAAGLLMGAGGAVAVADPGSSGSAAHGDQHSTDAKKPKDEKAEGRAWRHGHQGRLAWLGRATRPAAFHRREKAEGREESRRTSLAARDTTDGTKRRLGPRCRGS